MIRAAQPKQLFLVSDAARDERGGESELVAQTRAETESQIDWDCQVQKIYADRNMGCGPRISSAITQAFQSVAQLIVLEDDCVADPTFFDFCGQTLERFENDNRIMSISGDNFQNGISRTDDSYYFSKYTHCWGWATWKRAWQHFSLDMPSWPEFRDSGGLHAYCDNTHEIEYWTRIFNDCHTGNVSSWAYPWQLSCWMNHGLTVLPDVNLVTNIGFGDDATHTKQQTQNSHLASHSIDQIRHPQRVFRNHAADLYTDRVLYSQQVSTFKRLRRKIGLTSRRAA
ncbi:MAG: glycosyltransferase family 2 protein [Pirellulaceae bacterium]